MIDELVKAANAMRDAGISAKDWHGKFKKLPKVTAKEPCVRVWLTSEGHIHDLEMLSPDLALKLRKFEPDLGKSLPGFNVQPLFRIVKTDDEIKKASKGKAGEKLKSEWIQEFLKIPAHEQKKNDFWDKTRERMRQSFGKVREELEQQCAKKIISGEIIQTFFKVVKKIEIDVFQNQYFNCLYQKILDGSFPGLLLCYFVTEEKKKKEDLNSRIPVPKFSIFLDIRNYTDYPIGHPVSIERINDLLNNNELEQISYNKYKNLDAYGFHNRSVGKKFDEVILPSLGGVKIRSQVKAVPAQSRYDLCEEQTFHVGDEIRKRTKRALEWLSTKEHAGKTYGVAGDKELLFAYPKVLPKKQILLTQFFGVHLQDDSYQSENSFERIAASVLEKLKGFGIEGTEAEIEIFSLRKMDKARTKVVYYRNVTVAALEKASAAWHAGCQNVPALSALNWSRNKSEKTGKSYPVSVEVKTLFPIKLHRYLNVIWKHDGQRADTGKSKVTIFTPTDGLRLLLDRPNHALAAHMLSHFIRHAQGYFLTLCRATGKTEVTSLPDKEYYLGVLGLLLFNLENKKEVFMKESAFLLGRCLRVADEIHRLYCEVVRKKEFPSQLCGSSMLVGMMESPATSLSQLAMRSAPYVKWASACRDSEKVKLVHYWMRQWSGIADQLHLLELPKRLTPEERAQLFLGYLSSFPKNEKPTTEDQQTNYEIDNKGELQ
ncbi:MAG: hypothetical protein Q4G66_02865 [bacterium]|nr:hypothetical protein [bacterium]